MGNPASATLSEEVRRAGAWLIESGIQEPGGGVARYYRVDEGRNLPVSTEITGYAVSALTWLFTAGGEEGYLEAARRAARFLTGTAWDGRLGVFPFEHAANGAAPPPAYFFDSGIIVRGLLALWRVTGDGRLLECAAACGRGMARDFLTREAIHPILSLPSKRPPAYGDTWSRRPGCYQLKSALAWWELADATGEERFREFYEQALEFALADAGVFLPGADDRFRVMDRLHAFSYFLEALLPVAGRPACRAALAGGMARAAHHLHDIAAEFARSDVYAQLLRVRLLAAAAGAVPLDRGAAANEAAALAAFQISGPDRRVDGAFCFGKRGGVLMPFANPVSTAFCAQALTFWRRHEAGALTDSWQVLI